MTAKSMPNKCKWMISLCAVILLVLSFSVRAEAANTKEYSVSFKAGSKGTQSQTVKIPYGGTISEGAYQPSQEEIADGYYFTGWNRQVETTVTKKAVYVAQYARIIDEAVYRVNYVDTTGNELATQKIATTNEGANISEEALAIAGYQADAAIKTATAAKTGTEITFVYGSDAAPEVVNQEQTVVIPGPTTNQTTGTTNAGTTAGTNLGTAPGTQNPAAAQDNETAPAQDAGTTIVDEEVPLAGTTNEDSDTETLKDEEVPLADASADKVNPVLLFGIPAVLIALVAAFIIYKRRQGNKQ